jgi:CRP/FNR family cyclic AMP-dependent transcriptional regulator
MESDTLKQIPLFGALSKKERKAVARLADEVDVPEGEHLVEEGRFAHEFFAISDGSAEVIHEGKVINELGPGDFFGEIALITLGRRTASVVAKTPMKVVVIFGPNFNALNAEMPEIKKRIDAAIQARCAEM